MCACVCYQTMKSNSNVAIQQQPRPSRRYHAIFLFTELLIGFIGYAILGGIFGGMSLAYRKTHYTTVDGSTATIHEPTSGVEFQVSTSIISGPLPSSRTLADPGIAWSNANHMVLYDPAVVSWWTQVVVGVLMALVLISHLVFHYFVALPKRSCKCGDGPECCSHEHCCGDHRISLYQFLTACIGVCWLLALLIGGAVVGARFNKLEPGYCGTSFSTIDVSSTIKHWALPFYGHSNNFQDTYGPNRRGYTVQTNVYPIAFSSPLPDIPESCWLDQTDETSITFRDPKWVMYLFFIVMTSIIPVWIVFQLWCCPWPKWPKCCACCSDNSACCLSCRQEYQCCLEVRANPPAHPAQPAHPSLPIAETPLSASVIHVVPVSVPVPMSSYPATPHDPYPAYPVSISDASNFVSVPLYK